MKIEIKEISQIERELTLTVEAETAEEDYRKVLAGLRKYASIPGFRKGKAPLGMIEKAYGEQIREEFYNQKLNDYYKDALTEKELNPVDQGEAIKVEWERGKELVAVFKFEVMPEIKVTKYSNLEIPYEKIEFKPEMVDATIEDYRLKTANELDADSPSVPGDIITARITFLNDDGSDNKEIERTFALGENSYSENFNKNLTGKKPGDQVMTKLFSQGQEIQDKEIDPKFFESTARVEVLSVKRKDLPELNDEFAKDLEYDSLSDMKEKIAEELRLKIVKENEQRLSSAVMGKLIEENPFDLPRSFIHRYAESMAKPYAESYKVDIDKIIPMYYKMAEYNLKSHYIMDELLKLNPVDITPEEKDKMIAEAAENLKMETEKYRELYAKQIESEDFERVAKEKKIIKMVSDNSKFVPFPVENSKKDDKHKK